MTFARSTKRSPRNRLRRTAGGAPSGKAADGRFGGED
jgi:hypothetical protein